ncbi:MAG: AIPR family protein [Minisyncoccota bacterium]
METVIDLRVVSFKKADLPYLDMVGKRTYYLVANIQRVKEDLSELKNWREINPRHPNTKSDVAKSIVDTLENDPTSFVAKNVGLTVLIDEVAYDNKTQSAKIKLSDKELHGLLNGGNTYQIVTDFLEENDVPDATFIRIELLEGYTTREEVVELVEARNTSKQVEEVSLLNLQKKFDWIQLVLTNTEYGDRVAYTENDPKMYSGKKKDITITEIISYLLCFDVQNETNPVWVYSQKSKVLEYFAKEENFQRLQKYAPILDRILKLRDLAMEALQVKAIQDLDSVRKSRKKDGDELPFIERSVPYKIPIAFIYPLLSPLRMYVKVDTEASFTASPEDALKKVSKVYAETLADWMHDAGTPTKLGKMKSFWDTAGMKIKYELR